nr:DUF2029 domain-containing protein [Saprospiraceae bacterium]
MATIKNKRISRLLYLVWALGIILLAYLPQKDQFYLILFNYSIVFICYWLIIHPQNRIRLKSLLLVAVITRLLIIPATPNLTDDFYRYVWDGQLVLSVENPYEKTPEEWVNSEGDKPTFLDTDLYPHLNSKEYYSVYTPFSQLIFSTGTAMGRGHSGGAAFWIKVLIVSFDIVLLFVLVPLLRRLKKYPGMVAIYAFNPLVLLEISGNLHLEGVAVFFLALALLYYTGKRGIRTGIMMGLAAGVKIIPIILVPLMALARNFKQWFSFSLAAIVTTALLFIPLIFKGSYLNYWESIKLYYQTFEFNASIYNIVKFIGIKSQGYNWIEVIGPFCSLFFLLFYLIYLIYWRKMKLEKRNVIDGMVIALSLYFLFQTTVHPWYILPLVFLASISDWKFPVVWSGIIILSYSTYQTIPYEENLWITVISYLVVIASAIFLDNKRFRQLFKAKENPTEESYN